MKHLTLNHHTLPEALALEALPAWLDELGEEFHAIDTVNWADYPYRPEAAFRIVATDRGFVINYRVSEASVAAVAEGDCGHVWEDSCVEFFSCPTDDGTYYNIEANCVGTVLVAAGKDRNARTFAPREVLDSIGRWSSLGRDNFSERVGDVTWQLVLLVPYSVYFQHDVRSVEGLKLRANFYKCGDNLRQPHFLSWNPIDVPSPDFHRPDFFGELEG